MKTMGCAGARSGWSGRPVRRSSGPVMEQAAAVAAAELGGFSTCRRAAAQIQRGSERLQHPGTRWRSCVGSVGSLALTRLGSVAGGGVLRGCRSSDWSDGARGDLAGCASLRAGGRVAMQSVASALGLRRRGQERMTRVSVGERSARAWTAMEAQVAMRAVGGARARTRETRERERESEERARRERRGERGLD
ncbi:uncharacterized protein A4U43_C04F23190 [Asparagus officinalis]|uniref:Uncharacterized protein n=1 Tax=Asparagus officinalis TaxID=4686 RepID=A0A5P1F4W5_ASPOF|nr:uncharacterized protein A4U43_C04F23190 [Asparagus officinalis]